MNGAAIHSVRAVPDDQLRTIVEASEGKPLHVHLSEQEKENDACVAAYGATPTQLLADHGVLGPLTSAVHATHLTDDDVRTSATRGPTPASVPPPSATSATASARAGSSTTTAARSPSAPTATRSSTSSRRCAPSSSTSAWRHDDRGHWSATELLTAATTTGHASLGYDDAGAIAVGNRADLVTLDTTTPRTAGTGRDEHTAVFAATAADVVQVITDGRIVFARGDEQDIGRELDDAIGRLWP